MYSNTRKSSKYLTINLQGLAASEEFLIADTKLEKITNTFAKIHFQSKYRDVCDTSRQKTLNAE